MTLPVAVLAGGMAKRMHPLTSDIPKILLDVAGRPFAEHQLELLRRAGITEVVYCLGHLSEQVIAVLGDGSDWGMKFTYVVDGPRPLGTGGAVRLALPFLGPAFFVMYGDSYLRCDFAAIEAAFRESGKRGLMTVFHNEGRWDHSNVRFEDGRILKYDKSGTDRALKHIDYGLGILTGAAFDEWRDRDAFDLVAVYQRLIERDELAGYEVTDRFYEIGSMEGLEQTRALLEGIGGANA